MKLADLNPELHGSVAKGRLDFDCPHPGCVHRIVVQISDKPYHERPAKYSTGEPAPPAKVWQASGEFPDTLTLAPSIDIIVADANGNKVRTRCWHGFIQNGNIT